jgi:hypothetical protein
MNSDDNFEPASAGDIALAGGVLSVLAFPALLKLAGFVSLPLWAVFLPLGAFIAFSVGVSVWLTVCQSN